MIDKERERIQEAHTGSQDWYRWGPYLSERQWGTVREDYSPAGKAWEFFPHEHARSRAYRWGEDGLLGMSDDQGLLCFALSLWNEADPILKERFFGLTDAEGNHGEDVKEYYYFLENTPTHSYMKALYKYPQRAFPYDKLVEENSRRGKEEAEYELIDTGVFAENRYFDVYFEYAKVDPTDILVWVHAVNRGPEAAPLHLLPTLWFRNTWAWGKDERRPQLELATDAPQQTQMVHATHYDLGEYWLACEGEPQMLFTENESNLERLWGAPNQAAFVKDGIHEAVIHGATHKVNPQNMGTRVAAHYNVVVQPGATHSILLRLSNRKHEAPFAGVEQFFHARQEETQAFYSTFKATQSEDAVRVQRQALAGLLWSKQFYSYDVDTWLQGDPAGPKPPARTRNSNWRHLSNADVVLVPDGWEYPRYAAWNQAFHCVALALVDSGFAKKQLLLLLHERYMHPNGQLPAHEGDLGKVNPPVQAWASWKVYQQEKQATGQGDLVFLERVFQKLMLNLTWWINRLDQEGKSILASGFLGIDNPGMFEQNITLSDGKELEQSAGAAWLVMFCLNMYSIALELAKANPFYRDASNQLFDHFMYIADVINAGADNGLGLWDEEDGFFYTRINLPGREKISLRVRSLEGFIPLLALTSFDTRDADAQVKERFEWFVQNRPSMPRLRSTREDLHASEGRQDTAYSMLALVSGSRLQQLLKRLLDPAEFFSPYGIRSLSKHYETHPYEFHTEDVTLTLQYTPAESTVEEFRDNASWRGPVWFPLNFLLVDALREYHRFYGDDFRVECPTGSGNQLNLAQVADELASRLSRIFLRDEQGRRPVFGANETFQYDPLWRDYLLFHEYFNGDTGAGIGASHQTGATAVVANLLEDICTGRTAQERLGDVAFR